MDSWQGHCLCTSKFCFSFFHKFAKFTLTFLSCNFRIKHNMLVFMLVMMNLTVLSRLYLMKSFNVIMVSTWTRIKQSLKIIHQNLLHNYHQKEEELLNQPELELQETWLDSVSFKFLFYCTESFFRSLFLLSIHW